MIILNEYLSSSSQNFVLSKKNYAFFWHHKTILNGLLGTFIISTFNCFAKLFLEPQFSVVTLDTRVRFSVFKLSWLIFTNGHVVNTKVEDYYL